MKKPGFIDEISAVFSEHALSRRPGGLLVLELDGMDSGVFADFIAKGDLPNMAGLIESGASGDTISTIPPNSPTAWVTFYSGLGPATHGVQDWRVPVRAGSYKRRIITASTVGVRRLWEIAVENGLSVGAFFDFFLSGREEWRGKFIGMADMMTPAAERLGLPDELDAVMRKHAFHPRDSHRKSVLGGDYSGFDDEIEILIRFLESGGADLVTFHNHIIDTANHSLHKISGAGPRDARGFTRKEREHLQMAYTAVDGFVGRILDVMPEGMDLLIAADHGGGAFIHRFSPTAFLVREGFARLRDDVGRSLRMTSRLVGLKRAILGTNVRIPFLKKKVVDEWDIASTIDISSSTIIPHWSAGEFCGLRFNIEGRDEGGIIPPETVEETRSSFEAALLGLNEEAGFEVVRRVIRGEEIYSGPRADEMADIVIEFSDDVTALSSSDQVTEVISNEVTYGHRLKGAWIGRGPSFVSGGRTDLRMVDFAPLILASLGVPIPSYCEGRIPEGILTGGGAPGERTEASWKAGPFGPDETDSEVVEILQGLGYLE